MTHSEDKIAIIGLGYLDNAILPLGTLVQGRLQ